MIILVPESVHDELTVSVKSKVPEADLHPYSEDGPLPDGLSQAEGVLRWVAGKRYAELVEKGPQVRWLHTASAGVDHVLTPPVRAKAGLTVTDSGPAFEIAISEFVLAWMLMVARRLPDLIVQQQERTWKWITQEELYGKTVGIIGLGPIGQGVAGRAKAFGMRTLGLRRRPQAVASVDEVLTGEDGLTRLLGESDWVVIAAALTQQSHSLIGQEQIARMKPSAWLINIARGGLIDEPALITALQSGQIAGACLDVFAQEPLPQDSPLWTMPNVHIAPHNSSGWTSGLRERQKALFLDNLAKFAHGETLDGIVDIARGY